MFLYVKNITKTNFFFLRLRQLSQTQETVFIFEQKFSIIFIRICVIHKFPIEENKYSRLV